MTQPNVISLSQFREFDLKRLVSILLHDSENCRVVLFCLEAGQELAPHESSSEVILYVVGGKGLISVGDDEVEVEPEIIVVCPPMQPHGIKAGERTTVLAVITPRPE